MNQQTIEEPSKGGSYVRNADGTLTRVAGTEPAPQRDKREADKPADTNATPAPAKPAAAKQE
jgi:hypothetical protein